MVIKSLEIKLGKYSDVTVEEDLLEEHWDEVAKNKKLMVLAPDLAMYQILEDSGTLFTLVAYDGDTVVGYSLNLVHPHLHYKHLTYCTNDVLFVKKEFRSGSSIGLRLIKQTEIEAANRGAKLMLWHAKESSTLAKVLPRMGCSVQDIIFSKAL